MAPLGVPLGVLSRAGSVHGCAVQLLRYFVAFLARPVGAVVFGHLGDRIGRKKTLVATVLLMGVGTVGVGLVPGYTTLGPASAVILVALRIVGGIALVVSGPERPACMESGPARAVGS